MWYTMDYQVTRLSLSMSKDSHLKKSISTPEVLFLCIQVEKALSEVLHIPIIKKDR